MKLTRAEFIKQIEENTKVRCAEIARERGELLWGWNRIEIEDTCSALYTAHPDHPQELLDAEIID